MRQTQLVEAIEDLVDLLSRLPVGQHRSHMLKHHSVGMAFDMAVEPVEKLPRRRHRSAPHHGDEAPGEISVRRVEQL
jgi:hypothetical protein